MEQGNSLTGEVRAAADPAEGGRHWPGTRRISRRNAVIWGVALVALLAVLGSLLFATRRQGAAQGTSVGLRVGDRAPDFTLKSLQGIPVSLHQFLGRPVLLHFWAVDCTSCQAEQAGYLHAIKHLGAKAPVILAEDAWGEPADYARPYVRENHIPGIVLIDTSRGVFDGLYQGQGTPTAYYIDARGIIRQTAVGPEQYGAILANMKKIGV
ncbi:MAG: TlpA family protein disulfide reductase [Chloroflexota bacterium]